MKYNTMKATVSGFNCENPRRRVNTTMARAIT